MSLIDEAWRFKKKNYFYWKKNLFNKHYNNFL